MYLQGQGECFLNICSLDFDKSSKLPSLSLVLIFTPTSHVWGGQLPTPPQYMCYQIFCICSGRQIMVSQVFFFSSLMSDLMHLFKYLRVTFHKLFISFASFSIGFLVFFLLSFECTLHIKEMFCWKFCFQVQRIC